MKRNKIILLAALAATTLTSCSDWLDQEPLSNVSTSTYFKTKDQFNAAANRLYDYLDCTLYDNGTDLNYIPDLEISANSGANTTDAVFTDQYKRLRVANDVITQGEAYKGTDDISKAMGTAYFFRAWFHYRLLQRFGGVPIATEVPQTQSDVVWGPRNSRYEVIACILSDLEKAQQLLAKVTKASTSNDGSVDIEAVCAFKARVCLFEGTWEKYNGRGEADKTNGDGVNSGAGTAMPEGYPTVEQFLTMAKTESAKFVKGGVYADEYSIWMECEENAIKDYRRTSYRYLFTLENAAANPVGADKSSNNESILRRCYDASLNSKGIDGTHGQPCGGSRKLMDMFLCTDGLPINKSPLFKGYHGFNDEFENRDARMLCNFKQIGHYYWSANNETGTFANFSISPADSPENLSGCYGPVLTTYSGTNYNGNNGYAGLKFVFEARRDEGHSADLMLIRYPEMLLTYAEATIELNGKISDAELDNTINVIRQRAHIANLTNALVNDNGLDMKMEIRRERTLELYGEGFRLTDLCRWGTAEVELDRPVCIYYSAYNGVPTELATSDKPGYTNRPMYNDEVWKDHKITAEQPQDSYTAGMPTVKAGALVSEPESERNFSKKNYLQSIPTDEIQLNSNLKQNPGW